MDDPIEALRTRLQHSSQDELAREIGVSAAYLSMVLRGKRPVGPSVREFLKLPPKPKPCPFPVCGGGSQVVLFVDGSSQVVCQDCGACGPQGASRIAAVLAWNRR